MKKYFVFAAAALVALAACSKVEKDETPAKKISFNAALYTAQTKADPATNHSLNEGEGVTAFKSKAFLHAAGVATTQDMFGAAGETISYYSTVPEWAPANEYFWPKAADSYINFVSWYTTNDAFITPANVTETAMSWGTSGSPITITRTDNILFADEAWHYKDNVRPATYNSASGVAEGVPTLFHHALAKLALNMKLKTTTASTKTVWDVEIQEATVKIGNNGYLPLVNAEPSGTTPATSAWTVNSAAATSAIVGWTPGSSLETIVETSSTASNVTKDLAKLTFENFAPRALTDGKFESASQVFLAERTVMPQTLGTTVKFALKFKISMFHDTDNDGTKNGAAYSEEVITISECDLTSLIASPASWNMNTKVIYTITIDPVGKIIKFDPAVVDWYEPAAVEGQVYPQPQVNP